MYSLGELRPGAQSREVAIVEPSHRWFACCNRIEIGTPRYILSNSHLAGSIEPDRRAVAKFAERPGDVPRRASWPARVRTVVPPGGQCLAGPQRGNRIEECGVMRGVEGGSGIRFEGIRMANHKTEWPPKERSPHGTELAITLAWRGVRREHRVAFDALHPALASIVGGIPPP